MEHQQVRNYNYRDRIDESNEVNCDVSHNATRSTRDCDLVHGIVELDRIDGGLRHRETPARKFTLGVNLVATGNQLGAAAGLDEKSNAQ